MELSASPRLVFRVLTSPGAAVYSLMLVLGQGPLLVNIGEAILTETGDRSYAKQF